MRAVQFKQLHDDLHRECAAASGLTRAGDLRNPHYEGKVEAYTRAIHLLRSTLGETPDGWEAAVALTADGRVHSWLPTVYDAEHMARDGFVVIALLPNGPGRADVQLRYDRARQQYRAERGYVGDDD